MLLIFEMETGIANACVLSSGILILVVAVVHSLVKASHAGKRYHNDHIDTLYQNDHGASSTPVSRPCELRIGVDKPRIRRSQSHLQHPISYPPRQREPYQQQYSPTEGSQGHASDKDGYSSGGSFPRMHRTLSTESGLLQAQLKPWNGVNNEMRSVLARKSGISAKDSTLVWHKMSWTPGPSKEWFKEGALHVGATCEILVQRLNSELLLFSTRDWMWNETFPFTRLDYAVMLTWWKTYCIILGMNLN